MVFLLHAFSTMSERRLSPLDQLLVQADKVLRTLSAGTSAPQRPSPAKDIEENNLNDGQKQHAAGLMRVNHAGEVCAQALYQGQALTAKLSEIRVEMEQAAREEVDHLAWCEERLQQLNSRPSLLNPVWYGLSFAIGATTGLISDKISLGFVAATEDQVCSHLENHLQALPENDTKSRAIVETMLVDEARHSHSALAAGGTRFPLVVKTLMSAVSKVMTESSYRI